MTLFEMIYLMVSMAMLFVSILNLRKKIKLP